MVYLDDGQSCNFQLLAFTFNDVYFRNIHLFQDVFSYKELIPVVFCTEKESES